MTHGPGRRRPQMRDDRMCVQRLSVVLGAPATARGTAHICSLLSTCSVHLHAHARPRTRTTRPARRRADSQEEDRPD